jgi:chemotaxis protein histidine kinase CheA
MNDAWTLLLETFRQEATELLDELAHLLETQRNGEFDSAVFVDARRVTHNLKGAALSVGALRISEPCHTLEDEFVAVASSAAPPTPEQLERWLELVTELQRALEDPNLVPLPSPESDASPSESVAETAEPVAEAAEPVAKPAAERVAGPAIERAAGAATPMETTIRVETRRLDDVMGHVREVALTQARLSQRNTLLSALEKEFEQATTSGTPLAALLRRLHSLVEESRQQVQEFGYLTDMLQASMNQVRMIPLVNMAPLWQRTVRETAHDLDRPCQLDVLVGDVEVDIHLYELLKDPMLHILRNAVVHGIEPPDERQARGKPRSGHVRLEARADGAYVQLHVSDDGRGIDPKRVARRAVERGWVSADAADAMSDTERRALIFLPGFSTAEIVTTVAGRGMGLHSVQRNLEELGGSVTVSSNLDLPGTTFKLRIPATILSVKGLLVKSKTITYALPLHEVAQVARVLSTDLEQSEGAPMFRDTEGRPIRVRWLDALLGATDRNPQSTLHLVVLRRSGQALALVVDSVVGEREFVTRPLPWNLDDTSTINGALILPDGSVALSLNATSLFASAQLLRAGQPALEPNAPARARRILVVDDSLSIRTLESQTLGSAGYEVSVSLDGQDAWEALQKAQFDLVVSDIQMPRMDGFELTTRIRNSESLRQLPVVLVTGLHSPQDIARGAEVGADEYIVKGQLDQEKLLRAVKRLLP